MNKSCNRPTAFPRIPSLLLAAGLLVLLASSAAAQEEDYREEIVVGFEIPKLAKQDIFVQYDGKTVYVPLIEVFGVLGFKVEADLNNDRISGFINDRSQKYVIDLIRFKITTWEREYELLRPEYYYDGRDFYLRVDQYGEIFGLHMKFDFALLQVLLPLDEDFPAYQKIRRQKERTKLQEKKESLRDVLALSRRRELFGGGVADWRVSTAPMGGGAQYADLEVGGVLFGGDFQVSGTGNTEAGIRTDQMDYRWHYYFEHNPYITQLDVGKFYSTGSLARGLTGVNISNKPQVRRKFFQTLRLEGQPGEGYEVELYVDNKLVDWMVVDANGRYEFNVDIFYSTSSVELKLYGPNGEIRTEQHHMRIPFNLIPEGEVEYSVAAGKLSGYSDNRVYTQGAVYYGAHTRITTGANVELPLNPLEGEKPLYSFEGTVQPFTNMTFSGSFSPRNRMDFDFNFSWPSVINAGAHVALIEENPITNPARQKQRIQLSLSSPLKLANRYVGVRLNASRDEFEAFTATNLSYGVNTSLKPFHVNYIGQYKINESASQKTSELASKIMGSVSIFRRFRPQFRIDYDHTLNEISSYSVILNRRLWRTGQISLTYQENPILNSNSIMVNLHFYTGFVEVSNRTQYSGGHTAMSATQRGSVRFDHTSGRFIFDRRQSVGYGAAVVRPFLDDNYNGKMDDNEQYLPGLKAKISGAGGIPRGKDRSYYYDRLRPYDEYLVAIDKYSLDNPLLKPSNEHYRVTPNPNVVTPIEVPIVQASEVSGSVKRKVGTGLMGTGGFQIKLLNISKDVLTEISTFSDGVFFYLGLLPGSYRAYIDPEQLQRYGYVCDPPSIEFDIRRIAGGEIIENLDFILSPAASIETNQTTPYEETE